jgi:hypothetical protein
MLSGATLSASEIAGTAVFRIVVSSDSIKNATATSHGKSRLLDADGVKKDDGVVVEWIELIGLALSVYSITTRNISPAFEGFPDVYTFSRPGRNIEIDAPVGNKYELGYFSFTDVRIEWKIAAHGSSPFETVPASHTLKMFQRGDLAKDTCNLCPGSGKCPPVLCCNVWGLNS